MPQQILLTGGKGMLSRWLVPELLSNGVGLRLMSRRPQPGDVPTVSADLTIPAELGRALEGIGTVIHSASSPAKDTVKIDVDGTRNLLEASYSAGVRHFV